MVASPTTSTWSGAITLKSASAIGVAAGSTLDTGTSAITGTGNDLVKFGPGTLTLRATSSDTFGRLVINAGNVTTGGASALTSSIPVLLDPGVTLTVGTAVTVGGLVLNGGAIVVGTAALTLAGNLSTSGTGNLIADTALTGLTISGNRTFLVSPAGTGNELTISSVVSGTGSITKIGPGTLSYTGNNANKNTGTTTVAEGPVNFAKTAAAIAGPLVVGNFSNNNDVSDVVVVTTTSDQLNGLPVTINSSGSLLMPNGTSRVGALTLNGGTLDGPVSGMLTLGGNVSAVSASTPAGVVSSIISGNLSLGTNLTFTVGDSFAPATTAIATATLSDSSTINVTVTNGGSDYTSPPSVTLIGGGGTYGSASAVVVGGMVVAINVTGASGYTTAPTVVVDPPSSLPDLTATAAAVLSGNTIGSITVLNGGGGYTSVPMVTITGGGGTGAEATAVLTNGVVSSIVLNNGGSGYTSQPTITITPVVPAPATAAVTLNGNSINGILTVANGGITNAGSGYMAAPRVTVTGGGVVGVTATATVTNGSVSKIVISPAKGFTSTPVIAIDPPDITATAAAETSLATGTITKIDLISAGAGYTAPPTVVLTGGGGTYSTATATINSVGQVTDITVSGSMDFTSVPVVVISPPLGALAAATTAAATATVGPSGGVAAINVEASGSGYSFPPAVTISGGGGMDATAVAQVTNGAVTGIVVTDAGMGYTTAPTITIAPPATASGTATISNGAVTGITLVSGGGGYSFVPTVTLTAPPSGGTQATAHAQVSNGVITAIVLDHPGSGYTTAPTVTISAAIPTLATAPLVAATATAAVSGGHVTVSVTNGGAGYTSPPTVALVGGSGTYATAIATVDPRTGSVTAITVTGSTGYATNAPPTVVIAPSLLSPFIASVAPATAVALLNASGGVSAVTLTNPGAGYTAPPEVTITGDGAGATATATVVNGIITAITVDTPGSGYTSPPTVTIDVPPALSLANLPGLTITGLITASANNIGFIKSGSGTLELNGVATNTYTGNTLVNEGTLLLNNQDSDTPTSSNAIPANTTLIIGNSINGPGADVVRLLGPNQLAPSVSTLINDSGQFDLNGFSNAVGALSLAGGIITLPAASSLTLGAGLTTLPSFYEAMITGSGTLDLGGAAGSFNIAQGNNPNTPDLLVAAPITDDGGNGVVKTGDGTLLFNFANDGTDGYSGSTTINAGTLLVDGIHAGVRDRHPERRDSGWHRYRRRHHRQ